MRVLNVHVCFKWCRRNWQIIFDKDHQALVAQIWKNNTDSPLCAVTAPTGLAAFNVGGVTIHRLLQLPIEHEGKTAGYW